jgi:hypothetical protein
MPWLSPSLNLTCAGSDGGRVQVAVRHLRVTENGDFYVAQICIAGEETSLTRRQTVGLAAFLEKAARGERCPIDYRDGEIEAGAFDEQRTVWIDIGLHIEMMRGQARIMADYLLTAARAPDDDGAA